MQISLSLLSGFLRFVRKRLTCYLLPSHRSTAASVSENQSGHQSSLSSCAQSACNSSNCVCMQGVRASARVQSDIAAKTQLLESLQAEAEALEKQKDEAKDCASQLQQQHSRLLDQAKAEGNVGELLELQSKLAALQARCSKVINSVIAVMIAACLKLLQPEALTTRAAGISAVQAEA